MIPEGRDMQRNGRELKFIAGFILFFLIGQAGNYFLRRYAGDMVIHSLNAVPASVIINLLTPDEKTVARDIRICGPNVSMMIKRGCEGSEGMVLVLAAVLAFPAGIRKKLTAVLIGIIIVYVANLSRIVALFYSLRYIPDLFQIMHVYAGQVYIIVVSLMYFLVWATRVMRHEE